MLARPRNVIFVLLALGLFVAAGCAPARRAPEAAAPPAATTPGNGIATAPATLVPADYRAPKDRVASTGATLPANGKPTVVFVDAIWCVFCAMARPVVHQLRYEYQDRVNFVILDYDLEADAALARRLGVYEHPAFGLLPPDSTIVTQRVFGPLPEAQLRRRLDALASAAAPTTQS